jgi:hypothetical protein
MEDRIWKRKARDGNIGIDRLLRRVIFSDIS